VLIRAVVSGIEFDRRRDRTDDHDSDQNRDAPRQARDDRACFFVNSPRILGGVTRVL
jgi:hypothetical protein